MNGTRAVRDALKLFNDMNIQITKRVALFAVAVSLLCAQACSTTVITSNKSGHVPPGQAKKATGSQSAKPYAPGQQKKNKN